MVGADLVRAGATLVPVAVAGLDGSLPLWGLVVAAFVLEAATSYFAPAYGATIPAVVDRENVQAGERARPRDRAGALDRRLGARGRAARPSCRSSTFFAVDAATFFVSALLILGLRAGGGRAATRRGAAAARGDRRAAAAARALARPWSCSRVAMTITTGCWIAGVPTLVRDTLHEGAGGFSVVMIGFAVGSIARRSGARAGSPCAEGTREHARLGRSTCPRTP